MTPRKALIAALIFLFASCAKGAEPQVSLGGELYWLRRPSDFALYYSYQKHRIVFDINWPDAGYEKCKVPWYMDQDLRDEWPDRVSQSFGVYDRPFVEQEGADKLAETIENALNRADDYVWFYPECHDHLKGATEELENAVEDGKIRATGKAKLLLFGVYDKDGKPTNTPQYIADNLHQLRTLPYDGLTVFMRTEKQTYDQGLTRKLFSKQGVKVNELLDALGPLRGQNRFEIFVECYSGLQLTPSVYDDEGWKTVIRNMERLGAAVKQLKLHGVFMDTENYDGEKCWLSYKKNDLKQAQKTAFERGKDVAKALDCKVITTVAPIYAMTEGHKWGKDYELLGPFIAGMASQGEIK